MGNRSTERMAAGERLKNSWQKAGRASPLSLPSLLSGESGNAIDSSEDERKAAGEEARGERVD